MYPRLCVCQRVSSAQQGHHSRRACTNDSCSKVGRGPHQRNINIPNHSSPIHPTLPSSLHPSSIILPSPALPYPPASLPPLPLSLTSLPRCFPFPPSFHFLSPSFSPFFHPLTSSPPLLLYILIYFLSTQMLRQVLLLTCS